MESTTISGYNTHRPEDIRAMLDEIGVEGIPDLFGQIPASIRLDQPLQLPAPLSEWQLQRHVGHLAAQNATAKTHLSFLGGGAYDHHIPAVVDTIASRGEFLTSYTPYQPEISQGLLQALFEYQLCLAELTGLPVVNGSCYDGATALADAAWAGCLIGGDTNGARVVHSSTLWPQHLEVLRTYMTGRGVMLVPADFDQDSGRVDIQSLATAFSTEKPAAFAFQHPNALGVFEDVGAIADLCKKHGVVCICSFNPLAAGIVEAPGKLGVDIVVCDGQPLGLPLSAGGPSLGVFAIKREYRKHVPGRLIGKVTDINGNQAYALVFEDREQHVARESATSNICSNQAINALRAAVYLSLLGGSGLQKLASLNTRKAHYLTDLLRKIPGVELVFSGDYFNEVVIKLPKTAKGVLENCLSKGIFAGIDYSGKYGLDSAILIATTETKSKADLDLLAAAVGEALS